MIKPAAACVPATMPEAMVAIAGLPLEVTLHRGRKSRPSRAMANSTRGIGNMEPSRLKRQAAVRNAFTLSAQNKPVKLL